MKKVEMEEDSSHIRIKRMAWVLSLTGRQEGQEELIGQRTSPTSDPLITVAKFERRSNLKLETRLKFA